VSLLDGVTRGAPLPLLSSDATALIHPVTTLIIITVGYEAVPNGTSAVFSSDNPPPP